MFCAQTLYCNPMKMMVVLVVSRMLCAKVILFSQKNLFEPLDIWLATTSWPNPPQEKHFFHQVDICFLAIS
jgi:hypothetical protein